MRHQQLIANLGLIFALGIGVAAEQEGGMIRREDQSSSRRQIDRTSVRFAGVWLPISASGDTRVIGTVVDIRQVPVAAAQLQLRNLDTGLAEQETESNDDGEFEFIIEQPGTYVVEMTMAEGLVVAVSNAGALSRFETLQTVIQLPGRWDAVRRDILRSQTVREFLGIGAEITMATTLSIALEQNIRPVDAGEPVSPQR